MLIQSCGLYFFFLCEPPGNITPPATQPAKLKLITLITAEGSIDEPFTKKPTVNNATTRKLAVNKLAYKAPVFLFLPVTIPAVKAETKLITELVYPKAFSLHPASFSMMEERINKSNADKNHANNALRMNEPSKYSPFIFGRKKTPPGS